jgi:hypothetical protein
VSYLFAHFDSGLSSITLLKNDIHVHNFEEAISNAAVLLPFAEAIQNPDFQLKVQEHCPGVEKEPIYGADKIKSTIIGAGKLLGSTLNTIGDYLASGVNYVGEFLNNQLPEPEQKTDVPPETKQKWEHLKQGTSNILDVSRELYNKYLAYYVDAGIGYGKQMNASIDASNYSAVKYAKCTNCDYYRTRQRLRLSHRNCLRGVLRRRG